MRGRNNNNGGSSNNNSNSSNSNNNNSRNRGGPNPLTRSYESNGPDVKIRGTAQNIAEKYLTLARDAQSSGDRVMAENYLQHAEHYNRIIAGALAQQQQNQRDNREEEEDLGTGNGDNRFDDVLHAHPQPRQEQAPRQEQPQRHDQQPQPDVAAPFDSASEQPVIVAAPREDGAVDEQPRQNPRQRQPRESGQPRENNRESGAANAERPRTPRPRVPRPPREPRVEVAAESTDAPAEGGLLATLSRGADRPIPVTADE
jgi:Domain of unknown function (DUF4167)